MRDEDTTYIRVMVSVRVRDRLAELAVRELRTMSNMAGVVLQDYVDQQGSDDGGVAAAEELAAAGRSRERSL